MTDAEAVVFLKKYLDEYEALAKSLQSLDRPTDQDLAVRDSLRRRVLPVSKILWMAGVLHVQSSIEPDAFDSESVSTVRRLVTLAIGAYEYGMVPKPASPVAAAKPSPPPPAPPVPAVVAPHVSGLQESIQNHWIRWAIVWFIAGFAVGLFIRDGFDRAAHRLSGATEAPAKWGK